MNRARLAFLLRELADELEKPDPRVTSPGGLSEVRAARAPLKVTEIDGAAARQLLRRKGLER